jgi:prepilin-type N-terminal cleavage/methylation domain-containing protein
MNTKKGFTIIELIVVIAIIAVLAAIVLVNVTSYINKGKDAAAKGNLTTAITNAAVFYDTLTTATPAGGGGTYVGFNTAAGTGAALYTTVYSAVLASGYAAADIASSCDVAACGANSSKWCMSVKLKAPAVSGSYFCVDTTGKKAEGTTATCASGVCGG